MRIDGSVSSGNDTDEDEGELKSEETETSSDSSEGVTSEEGEIQSDGDDNGLDGNQGSPVEETPWERGLRLARERARRAKLLRQTDVDLEEKKLKLTVTAPEANDEDELAAVENGRSNFADIFWLNYYKLAVVGCSQLTGKRSLPSDVVPPTESKLISWRRHLAASSVAGQGFVRTHRSSSSSGNNSESENSGRSGRSRTSSLSSLAGSILLAVPELAVDDESDRDAPNHYRHGRRRGSSSSASSASPLARHRSRRYPNAVDEPMPVPASGAPISSSGAAVAVHASRRKRFDASGRSSSARTHSSSSNSSSSGVSVSRSSRSPRHPAKRSQSPPRHRKNSVVITQPAGKPSANDEDGMQIRRNKRPPIAYLQHHRASPSVAVDGNIRSNESGSQTQVPRWATRNSDAEIAFGDNKISKQPNQSEKSLMPTWTPNKTRATGSGELKVAIASTRSPWDNSPSLKSKSRAGPDEKPTYITSWSQASPSAAAGCGSGDEGSHSRRPPSGNRYQQQQSQPQLAVRRQVPDRLPARNDRRAPSQLRRKSRSPFADVEFGHSMVPGTSTNQPLPATSRFGQEPPDQPQTLSVSHATSYEQTVPLLAGSVNPGNPLGVPPLLNDCTPITPGVGGSERLTGELPAASSRPGVKLKIAPRVKGPALRPESGLAKPPYPRLGDSSTHQPPKTFNNDASGLDRNRGIPQHSFQTRRRSQSRSISPNEHSFLPLPTSKSPGLQRARRRHEAVINDGDFSNKRARQADYIAVSPGELSVNNENTRENGPNDGFASRRKHSSPSCVRNVADRHDEPFDYRSQQSRSRYSGGQLNAVSWSQSDARGSRGADMGHNFPRDLRNKGRTGRGENDGTFDGGSYVRRFEDRAGRNRNLIYRRPSPSPAVRGGRNSRRVDLSPSGLQVTGGRGPYRSARGRTERSRSPFESLHREDAVAAEQRLNELRQRLTMVDDAIAELRAHSGSVR